MSGFTCQARVLWVGVLPKRCSPTVAVSRCLNYMCTPILALRQHALPLSWDAGGCRGGVGVSGSREGQMGKAVAWEYFEKSRVRETDSHSVQSCPAGLAATRCSQQRSIAYFSTS